MFRSLVPEKTYRDPEGRANWNIVNVSGEMMRRKDKLVATTQASPQMEYIERCLTTPYSGKTTYEHVFEGVRAVGIERNFFSSDCGNPDYPPVEDGLAVWADELLGAGFGEDEIHTMVVEGSRRLARHGLDGAGQRAEVPASPAPERER